MRGSDFTRLFELLSPLNQQKVMDFMEALTAEQEMGLIAGDASLDENLREAESYPYIPEETFGEEEDEELLRFFAEAGRHSPI